MFTWRGSLSPELSVSGKTSEKLLHWFLAHWRKQDGQKLSCSRKWRSKEGPAQALHSCSLPVQLYKLNAAGQDSSKLWRLQWHCNCLIIWIPHLLETLDILQFWDSALATSWLPPALYDVCYSQAGRKAVSASWAQCKGHRQWRRQTRPTTRGARGLLLAWVFILELGRSMS